MKTSVIIVTYNRPHFLSRVLDGYLHQTKPPNEILIADDGSTKETADMIKSRQQNTNCKIVHVWHEDTGFKPAQIRNKAIAQSMGTYTIISDDDSIPCPTMVEDHMRYAEEGFFIQGHRVLLGPNISTDFTYKHITLLKILGYAIRGQTGNTINTFRFPFARIRKSTDLKGIRSCNMSFYKRDFIAVNGFNEEFEGWGKEDSELVVRFFKYGLKKKDVRFRACCYHLYHDFFSRKNLDKNVNLLEESQNKSNYFCENGINKYLT